VTRASIMKFCVLPLMLMGVGIAGKAWGQELTVTGQVVILAERGKAKHQSNSDVVVWLTPISGVPPHRIDGLGSHERRVQRIIQKHKQFVPHMVIVPVGGEVEFPNLDPFFHNVFSLFEGKRFDLGLYEAGSTRTVRFDRAGVCYIFCNIHSEMGAVVIVLGTPYFAISNSDGKISISGVPPGRYQMDLWSEKASPDELKSLGRLVNIDENVASLGRIQLSGKNPFVEQHLNKYGAPYDTPSAPNPAYIHP
jgi:plastocyanin